MACSHRKAKSSLTPFLALTRLHVISASMISFAYLSLHLSYLHKLDSTAIKAPLAEKVLVFKSPSPTSYLCSVDNSCLCLTILELFM
jgi:hypothetical protein